MNELIGLFVVSLLMGLLIAVVFAGGFSPMVQNIRTGLKKSETGRAFEPPILHSEEERHKAQATIYWQKQWQTKQQRRRDEDDAL